MERKTIISIFLLISTIGFGQGNFFFNQHNSCIEVQSGDFGLYNQMVSITPTLGDLCNNYTGWVTISDIELDFDDVRSDTCVINNFSGLAVECDNILIVGSEVFLRNGTRLPSEYNGVYIASGESVNELNNTKIAANLVTVIDGFITTKECY